MSVRYVLHMCKCSFYSFMRSFLVSLDFASAGDEGSGETVRMRKIVCAFTYYVCDKY